MSKKKKSDNGGYGKNYGSSPKPTFTVSEVNGRPTLTAINGTPTYGGFGGGGSGVATRLPSFNKSGGDDNTAAALRPAFNGYAPDSFYDKAIAEIANRRTLALNAATAGERDLSNDYGLGIKQNALGAEYAGQWAASDPNQLGIDPSNPFSRASLLNKSYFVAGKVGEGSYANRGLLTSGAYQRSQSRDAFRNEQGRDALIKNFASGLQDYRQRRAQSEADARAAEVQAKYDLFQRNRENYDRMYGLNG